MALWRSMIWLAVAGACGTLARYAMSSVVQRLAGPALPYGTLAVNVAGCFLAGVVWALFEKHALLSGHVRTILLVGFMGSFTTLSAVMLESAHMLRDAEWGKAVAYAGLQFVTGLAATIAGLRLAGSW